MGNSAVIGYDTVPRQMKQPSSPKVHKQHIELVIAYFLTPISEKFSQPFLVIAAELRPTCADLAYPIQYDDTMALKH